MSDRHYMEIEIEEIVRETERSFGVKMEGESEWVWIPKSQIADWEDYEVGDRNLEISVTRWIAKQKGWL